MSKYKVLNWSEYNESLKNRGSLSLWISEEAIEKWKPKANPKFIGAPQQFSDKAILCIMTLNGCLQTSISTARWICYIHFQIYGSELEGSSFHNYCKSSKVA